MKQEFHTGKQIDVDNVQLQSLASITVILLNVFILLYWLICIHSYFPYFLHSICWNSPERIFPGTTQLCKIAHVPWCFIHLWILKKLHKKPLWKAVLSLEKIFFVSYITRYIIHGFVAKKMYSQKLVLSRKCVRKVRFIRLRILPAVVIAPLILVLCMPKQARAQCHHPRVMEKKMWSFLTTFLVHSFWINVQMPWTVV